MHAVYQRVRLDRRAISCGVSDARHLGHTQVEKITDLPCMQQPVTNATC